MHLCRNFCYSIIVILLVLLSSCSTTHQAYLRTLRLAIYEPPNISLQTNDIRQSPVDLIYVKKGDFPTIVLALAYIESGEYKWISADKTTLIEKNGRIIKTLALEHNLDFLKADEDDPLGKISAISNTTSWDRIIDFNKHYFGVQISSSFEIKGADILIIQEQNIETVLIEERVVVIDSDIRHFTQNTWLNQFWLNKTSGQVVRSKQKIMPDTEYFDITYVSRALRL
jgi:hypothetical protein